MLKRHLGRFTRKKDGCCYLADEGLQIHTTERLPRHEILQRLGTGVKKPSGTTTSHDLDRCVIRLWLEGRPIDGQEFRLSLPLRFGDLEKRAEDCSPCDLLRVIVESSLSERASRGDIEYVNIGRGYPHLGVYVRLLDDHLDLEVTTSQGAYPSFVERESLLTNSQRVAVRGQ